MSIVRIVWPLSYWSEGDKVLGIFDTVGGEPQVCTEATKIQQEDWDNLVASAGGVEQDVIDALGCNVIRDMR